MKKLYNFLLPAILILAAFQVKASAPSWSVNPASYQYNMTMVAVAEINCTELVNPSNRIGVFSGNTCRGTALTSQIVNGKYTASLFIYSNVASGETLTFKVYNSVNDSVYTMLTTVQFQQNAAYGTSTSPFLLINNNPPADISLSALTLSEGLAVNGTVGTFATTDSDAGSVYTYSLVSGTGSTNNNLFSISSGLLKLASSVDYETQRTASVRVRASDGSGCAIEKVFTLSITNVNESPVNIFLSDTSIYENQPALAQVGVFTDSDPDSADQAYYSLVSGTGSTDNAAFTISGSTLKAVSPFNYEAKSVYSIRVRVRDGANNSFEKVFYIAVKDANDVPSNILVNGALTASFAENRTIGSWLANLSTVDEDPSNTFIYSFVTSVGNDNSLFQIVGNQLRSAAAFDFETRQNYTVNIQTNDGNGGVFSRQILLTVTDSNDAPSGIALSGNSVAENLPAASFVARLSTTDPDASQIAFTYTLVNGSGSAGNANFMIRNDSLLTNAVLNYEAAASWSVRIRTNDGAGGIYEQSFSIQVTDANDAPTDIQISSALVSENQPANTVIGSFLTTDQDAANTFSYSLVNGSGSTDNSWFNIMGASLRTSASFDFETKSSYSIRVRTSDGMGGTYEKVFTITVTNENDAPSAISLSNQTVKENRPINTLIGTLSTTDQDTGSSFTYTFSNVSGNDNSAFLLAGNQLKTAQSFNYEAKDIYIIYITSGDGNGGSLTRQFVINVIDSNDAPTDIALSSPTISENKPAQSFIGQLITTDADAAGSFTYSLVSGQGAADNSSFYISNDSLYTSAMLDFEAKSSYSVRIRSTDNGNLFVEKSFILTVINGNDPPTDIQLSSNIITENQAPATIIGNFTSIDPDTGNIFTYSLVPGTGATNNSAFTITANQLRSAGRFNYEQQKTFSIRVQSNDGNGGTLAKVFTIQVTDANDAPTDISLSGNTIRENLPPNSLIATISATDEDSAEQFTYSFATTSNNNNNLFLISGSQLKSNFSFDYETRNVYVVALVANDGKGGLFEKSFVINVLDSNDAPTGLELSNNRLDENQPAGTFIGVLTTDDADATSSFSLQLVNGTGGSDNALFSVRNDTLYSNSVFDYESRQQYSIRIKTTDNGGLKFERIFTIYVTNKNDDPVDLQLTSNTVTENLPARTTIGRFVAVDADSVNSFSYSLVAGAGDTDNSLFAIFGDQLRTNAVFNYESQASYSVRVSVNDGRGGSFAKSFQITVLDSNDAPTAISLSTTQVAENRKVGSLVAYISTTDQDNGELFTYSFYSGASNNNDQFLITGNELRTNALFDFEVRNFYIVYITSMDKSGAAITRQFVINVTDSTDKPTDLNISNTAIYENLAAPQFIGVLTSQDADQTDGFIYTLTGGAGSIDNSSFSVSDDSLYSSVAFNYEGKKTYQIRLRTTDATGVYFEKALVISILNNNDAPVALSLSGYKLMENGNVGDVIGSFTTSDPDSGDQFEYTLVAGPGDADNSSFAITGNTLSAKISADFEVKSSYTIRVQTRDLFGDVFEEAFIIQIQDENEVPVLTADTFSVSEDVAIGTTVGTLTASDPDAGQQLSYRFVDESMASAFTISNAGVITTRLALDYETTKEYQLMVEVKDNQNPALTATAYIVIRVSDIIEKDNSLPVTNYMSLNDDGQNDVFKIENVELYADYSLTVFNENGLEVYKVLRGYDNSWRGTYNDKKLPGGVYYYVFKDDKTGLTFKGIINIINQK